MSEIVNGNDVRVVEPRQRPGLAREAFREGRVTGRFRRKNLQCDDAIELPLPRFVNHPHAATAEQFKNLELRKMRRKFLGSGSGRRNGCAASPRRFLDGDAQQTARAHALGRVASHQAAAAFAGFRRGRFRCAHLAEFRKFFGGRLQDFCAGTHAVTRESQTSAGVRPRLRLPSRPSGRSRCGSGRGNARATDAPRP